jgi:hypothetical protein
LELVPDYDYGDAMESIQNGLFSHVREIPSTGGPVHLAYFNNLMISGADIGEVRKPALASAFADYPTYRDYLLSSAKRVGENARARERRHSIRLLATVSSGCDSTAAAVLAREAGAREAVTVAQARRTRRHLFNLNDSGAAVARQLGMTCKVPFRASKAASLAAY